VSAVICPGRYTAVFGCRAPSAPMQTRRTKTDSSRQREGRFNRPGRARAVAFRGASFSSACSPK
jgi:hypothetical protein